MAVQTRPYHHGTLRQALLRAGEEALRTRGVRDLSLRELAREVGVSHAAPRRHFADKQALLHALAEEGFDRLGHAMHEAVADRSASFEDRLGALARAYAGFALDHAALLDLMYESKRQPGAEAVRTAADRALHGALAIITEAQDSGEVVEGDPERLGIAVFAAIHGLASLAAGGAPPQGGLDAAIDDAVSVLVRGLRP